MNPKESISLEISCERRKGHQEGENLSPRKRFHGVLTTCQNIFQDESEIQIMMGEWWVGPHLDGGCLGVHIHGPLFELWLLLQDLEKDSGESSS